MNEGIKNVRLNKGVTKEEVNSLANGSILLEDDIYFGNDYKHNWKCTCCDNESFVRTWSRIKSENYNTCVYCRGGFKRRPNTIREIFIEKGMTRDEVNESSNNILILKDDIYLGAHHKHNWICNECGDTYIANFNTIKNKNFNKCMGSKCVLHYMNQCNKDWKRVKLVKGLSKDVVNHILNNVVIFEDDVFNSVTTSHKWRCVKCNNTFKKQWTEMKRERSVGPNCKDCNNSAKEADYSHTTFNNWKIKYVIFRNPKKYLCECTLCNNEYIMDVSHIVDGTSTKCRKCIRTIDGLSKTR